MEELHLYGPDKEVNTMESDTIRLYLKRIREQSQEILSLKKEREDFCSEKDGFLSKSESYSNEINDLNQRIEDNTGLCDHLNQTIKEKDTEINSLKDDNTKLRNHLNNMGTPDDQDEIIECLTKQLKKYKQIVRDIKD